MRSLPTYGSVGARVSNHPGPPSSLITGSRSAPWVMRPTVIRHTLKGFHPSGRPRTPRNRNATLPGLRSDGWHGFPGCAARPRAVVWNRVAVRTIDAYFLARNGELHRSLCRTERRTSSQPWPQGTPGRPTVLHPSCTIACIFPWSPNLARSLPA